MQESNQLLGEDVGKEETVIDIPIRDLLHMYIHKITGNRVNIFLGIKADLKD